MFLIQVDDSFYIDAEKIDTIFTDDGGLHYTLSGEAESFRVLEKYKDTFIERINRLNDNPGCELPEDL